MAGLGTIVNVVGMLTGCGVGPLLKGRLPKWLQDTISNAMGLCVVFADIMGTLRGLMTVNGGSLETQGALVSVACTVAGVALSGWVDVEYKLQQLGEQCKSRTPAGQVSGTFVGTFVNSSLLFCVRAIAIVGSSEDGLSHNYSTLFVKAVMDGILSVVFTAVLGIGTTLSVSPVAIYQGGITLLIGLARPFSADIMTTRVLYIGSILVFGSDLNLVLGSKIKIGNPLPAISLPIIACLSGF